MLPIKGLAELFNTLKNENELLEAQKRRTLEALNAEKELALARLEIEERDPTRREIRRAAIIGAFAGREAGIRRTVAQDQAALIDRAIRDQRELAAEAQAGVPDLATLQAQVSAAAAISQQLAEARTKSRGAKIDVDILSRLATGRGPELGAEDFARAVDLQAQAGSFAAALAGAKERFATSRAEVGRLTQAERGAFAALPPGVGTAADAEAFVGSRQTIANQVLLQAARSINELTLRRDTIRAESVAGRNLTDLGLLTQSAKAEAALSQGEERATQKLTAELKQAFRDTQDRQSAELSEAISALRELRTETVSLLQSVNRELQTMRSQIAAQRLP